METTKYWRCRECETYTKEICTHLYIQLRREIAWVYGSNKTIELGPLEPIGAQMLPPQAQMLDMELQGCVFTLFVTDLALAQSLFTMHFQIGKFMSLHVICMLCFAILLLLRLMVMFALCLGRDLGLLKC